jgi:hypothetical protein
VAEWLRSGLQSRLHRFDSGRRLSFEDHLHNRDPVHWSEIRQPWNSPWMLNMSKKGSEINDPGEMLEQVIHRNARMLDRLGKHP